MRSLKGGVNSFGFTLYHLRGHLSLIYPFSFSLPYMFYSFHDNRSFSIIVWDYCCCGEVVINAAQFHLTKSELIFCAGSNPARGVSKICAGENL